MSLPKSSLDFTSTEEQSRKHSIDEEKIVAKVTESKQDDEEDDSNYLSGLRLGLIMLGLCLSCLLVGLVSCPKNKRKRRKTDNF
jgi:hypothetical protein